jgi:molecular chaperone GrpE
MLREVLEAHRVAPILALGLPFDPDWHEAISTEASEHEAGLVIGEFERGYRIGEKVLRPSKVKVSKGPGQ